MESLAHTLKIPRPLQMQQFSCSGGTTSGRWTPGTVLFQAPGRFLPWPSESLGRGNEADEREHKVPLLLFSIGTKDDSRTGEEPYTF